MYGQDPSIVVRSKTKFNDPLKWKDPRKIFTCSWSDFFIKEADNWRDDAIEVIRKTPWHTYQILTKRPERMLNYMIRKLIQFGSADFEQIFKRVWLGISCENQKTADERIPLLTKTPAVVRFISAEPLLGPINLSKWQNLLDWVICGGESGPGARPFDIGWSRDLLAQCKNSGITFFMKQMGSFPVWTNPNARSEFDEGGGRIELKDRKGGDWNEWPEDIRMREFPK